MKTKIIPVIHYENDRQALRNANTAFSAGSDGIFLIDMSGANDALPLIAKVIKTRYPDKKIGINFLGMDPVEAVIANIGYRLDMTWTDVQLTHSRSDPWDPASKAHEILIKMPDHLLFVGVAFKHQQIENNPNFAAKKAIEFGFIPTTSGSATGVAAEIAKISNLRKGIGRDAPLAIASGITPSNVNDFTLHLSHILVATGVSASFYELDSAKLKAICIACDHPQ